MRIVFISIFRVDTHFDHIPFCKIFANAVFPDDLLIDDRGCGSWDEGESIWIGISKPGWKSSGSDQAPRRIHIEPQFDRIARDLTIKIHYEIDPYMLEGEARGEFTRAQIDQFLVDQTRFRDYVWEHGDGAIQREIGWRKIGIKQIPFTRGTRVSEIRQMMIEKIYVFADIIDSCRRTADF